MCTVGMLCDNNTTSGTHTHTHTHTHAPKRGGGEGAEHDMTDVVHLVRPAGQTYAVTGKSQGSFVMFSSLTGGHTSKMTGVNEAWAVASLTPLADRLPITCANARARTHTHTHTHTTCAAIPSR